MMLVVMAMTMVMIMTAVQPPGTQQVDDQTYQGDPERLLKMYGSRLPPGL